MTGRHSDKKSNNKILIFIEIILIIIAIISLMNIIKWCIDNTKSAKLLGDVSNFVEINDCDKVVVQSGEEDIALNEYNVNFSKLKSMNEDTVLWIKVNNTQIEYPVVKADDNNFYLSRSFDKSYNSAGWIFADYRDKADGTDQNLVIYGHNRRDGTMFGTLKNILTPEWYNNEENKYITVVTEEGTQIYQVISVYQVEAEDYYTTTSFPTDREFDEFISKINRRSLKDFKVPVNKNDKILTLSTCANNNKYRVVLHAKKLEKKVQKENTESSSEVN